MAGTGWPHTPTRTPGAGSGAAAAVFEFSAEPGKHIIVHNVHQVPYNAAEPGPNDDPEDAPALRALVDLTWAAMQPYPKIWPPIIAGDFNGDPELLPVFTRSHKVLMDQSMTCLSANPRHSHRPIPRWRRRPKGRRETRRQQ